MQDIWIQLIVTVGTIIAAIIGAIKYLSNQSAKREAALLAHTQKTEEMMLEYFEKKNGHVERIVKDSNAATRKLAAAVTKLSGKIGVLKDK